MSFFFNRWFCDKFPRFSDPFELFEVSYHQKIDSCLFRWKGYFTFAAIFLLLTITEFKLGCTPSYICSNSRSPPPLDGWPALDHRDLCVVYLSDACLKWRKPMVSLKLEIITSWWFQPIWKILVKLGIFPRKGWKLKIFETTTSIMYLTSLHCSVAKPWTIWWFTWVE